MEPASSKFNQIEQVQKIIKHPKTLIRNRETQNPNKEETFAGHFLFNIITQSNKTFHKGKSTINSKAEKIITFFLNLLIEILNIDCLIWWNVASQHLRYALPPCDAVLGALNYRKKTVDIYPV